VKCDSVEKRRSYRLSNITAYRFFSLRAVYTGMYLQSAEPI